MRHFDSLSILPLYRRVLKRAVAFSILMTSKIIAATFLLFALHCILCGSSWAKFAIDSLAAIDIEMVGYNGLADNAIFKGRISAGDILQIDTPYRGLALLICADGQRYPVIIGDEHFTLNISSPEVPPDFTAGSENEFFYKLLSGDVPEGNKYPFPHLMIQAKKLLESSHSIHTHEELAAKKKEFHDFARDHYNSLQHSDMVRRLIAQYFMMHEYVDYLVEGAPATDIKIKYQQAVLSGVGSWLKLLKSHIPGHEILNYCVSLYYDRSMVSLASLIIEKFREVAYCPGEENKTFSFSEDLLMTDANGNNVRRLNESKGNKIIAFVSEDCPVSMVETTSKARKLIEQKEDVTLVVVPLQELSETHLAMNRMVSGGNMFFVKGATWRKENLVNNIKLPLFQYIEGGHK